MLWVASVFLNGLPICSDYPQDTEFSPKPVSVFSAGESGFAVIRIPSILADRSGSLLAFAEGRSGGASDQASNKIILKRSKDQGRTWGRLSVVADDGSNSLNNPCAVLDRSTGRIFLMFQRVPSGLNEGSSQIADGYISPNAYRSMLTWTDDGGSSWHRPEDITTSVKRPEGVKTVCSGPGIGIQLTRGKFRGRLIVPFNEGPYGHWNNYAAFSDDHGKHWHMGERVPGAHVEDAKGRLRSQINEVQMAELSDGSVLLNSRQFAGNAVRKQAVSRDGGQTWSPVQEALELRDPSCMGSLLRYRFDRKESGIMLYSGPDSSKRENGTLYASLDDGKTWPIKRALTAGDFAYSVLIGLSHRQIGCLYESDNYGTIQFIRVPESWLLSH